MAQSSPPISLIKDLYNDITRLKLLDTEDADVRFKLIKSPFTGDDDEEINVSREEYVITGLIYPNSDIYKEAAFEIEIKLPVTFPFVPPTVRFITPIYHPNVAENGEFCNDLLTRNNKWTPKTSLVQILKIVVQHVDEPDPENPIRAAVGVEYKNNRAQFDKNARENVAKNGRPRN